MGKDPTGKGNAAMYDGQPPFTTNPILLKNLLAQVEQGALQLPDFQRGWVWDARAIDDSNLSAVQ